jgi:putative tricarboxylic transport membrane protein
MKAPGRRSLAVPEALIGAGVVVFAGLLLWQILSIPVSPLYAKVGPTVFPYMTGAGLAVIGVLLVIDAARGGWQPPEEAEVGVDWRSLGFVIAGLVLNVALIGPLGFTAASTVMFVLVAYGFGSRRIVRDALIGFAVALAAYFGFAKALGVNIGGGLIEGLLGA